MIEAHVRIITQCNFMSARIANSNNSARKYESIASLLILLTGIRECVQFHYRTGLIEDGHH